MNKHNYLMALAMNSNVGTLRLENATIPVKITEVESENNGYSSPMTTFKCLVVNDDQIEYRSGNRPWSGRPKENTISGNIYVPSAMVDSYKKDPYWSTYANQIRAMDDGNAMGKFGIKRVIFNNPATIVIWADGTKTVVKCQEGDVYSKETGLALCFAKRALGNTGSFNDVFHKWIPEEEDENA